MDSPRPTGHTRRKEGALATETAVPKSLMISCIRAALPGWTDRPISAIGGRNSDSTPWRLNLDDAILGIEQGRWAFHTLVEDRRVNVVVAQSASGRKYLKTEMDGELPQKLLSLPNCA